MWYNDIALRVYPYQHHFSPASVKGTPKGNTQIRHPGLDPEFVHAGPAPRTGRDVSLRSHFRENGNPVALT